MLPCPEHSLLPVILRQKDSVLISDVSIIPAYGKYLLELNFRVDGSSKFQPGHQYGFFPSAALGWRFSEESFVKPYIGKWLASGKLRASYGKLGNNSGIGRYQQQEVLYQNNYMLDGSIAKGFVYSKMLNPDLTWESTGLFNLGLDLMFFDGKLAAEFDYYEPSDDRYVAKVADVHSADRCL